MATAAVHAGVEVRLLGRGRQGGRTLRLGGPRQRALLAALALRAGEVVSVDSLAYALFGPERHL